MRTEDTLRAHLTRAILSRITTDGVACCRAEEKVHIRTLLGRHALGFAEDPARRRRDLAGLDRAQSVPRATLEQIAPVRGAGVAKFLGN